MINLIANEKLKQLGCKWVGGQWVAPELAKQEADLIKNNFYGDLITIEVLHTDQNDRIKGSSWGYSHVRLIAGYIVASAGGRDSGAKIADGVAIIDGRMTSGGSVKNFICDYTENLKIRMKVSRNTLDILDKEQAENKYTYTIIDQPLNTDSLKTEKEKLLQRLAEIDQLLKNSN